MTNDLSLDDLRREIDEIDDQLHDLLMRRTEIVGRVGAVKRLESTPGHQCPLDSRNVFVSLWLFLGAVLRSF